MGITPCCIWRPREERGECALSLVAKIATPTAHPDSAQEAAQFLQKPLRWASESHSREFEMPTRVLLIASLPWMFCAAARRSLPTQNAGNVSGAPCWQASPVHRPQ